MTDVHASSPKKGLAPASDSANLDADSSLEHKLRALEEASCAPEEAPGDVAVAADKKRDEPVLRVPSYVHRNGILLEALYSPEEQFPLHLKGHIGLKRNFGHAAPHGMVKILPPVLDDMVRQSVVLLPSKVAASVPHAKLLDKLIHFIHRYLDVPPFWEKLAAHYALMTWVYDRFTAVPYLRLVAEHGTGKSRFLQVVGALCYKSIICGGSVSVSSVFRLTDQWRGTLALDECDFNHSSEWAEIVRLLNCGYMAGLPAVRSESVGKTFVSRAFYVFGPKILAGRHRFADSALESRCLTYTPEERKLRDDVPRQLPACFWDESLDLRNQMLSWRFENFDTIRVDESPLLHLDPRLAQIGTTLYCVAKDDEFRGDYLRFLSEFGREDRAERPQSLVVEAIRDLLAEVEANQELYKELNTKAPDYLTVKALTDRVNALIQDRGGNQIGPKRVGVIIRSLGFKPQRARDGYRFVPDPKRVEELAEKYVPKAEE